MDNKILDAIDNKIILYKRTKNKQYFNQACEMIYPYLKEYAARLISEVVLQQYIEDIVIDTILKMHDKTLDYYTHYASAYYYDWCCSLLRSIKCEYLSAVYRKPFVPYNEDDDARDDDEYTFSDKNELITDTQYKEDLYAILAESINLLTGIKRRVIEELYINNKTYQDVAKELDMRMDLLKYYVYTAKNDMKKMVSRKHPNI